MSGTFAKATSAGLAGLAALGCFAARAPAQAVNNPLAAAGSSFASPYWGYSNDPYGGYLHGAADVIRAQSMYLVSYQDAARIKEEVRAAKIDNRRKELEQWLWERDNLPTRADNQERDEHEQFRQAVNASLTEVWSAKALNALLDHSLKDKNILDVPVNEEVLDKINVSSGVGGGNIGLLRGGRVKWWPLLLRRPEFADDREKLEVLAADAVRKAADGRMDAEAIEEMMATLKQLSRKLQKAVRTSGDDLSPMASIEARSFLNQFSDALRALQRPEAKDLLIASVQGKTVAEVIKFMNDHGLRFAPATPSAETAYTALHRAMAQAYEVKGKSRSGGGQ